MAAARWEEEINLLGHIEDPVLRHFDFVTSFTRGSLAGRTLDNYRMVSLLFKQAKVEFYQNIFLNVGEILPKGYDVLLSVGAFYDFTDSNKPQPAALKLFYDGLRQGGIAQILYNPSQETWDLVQHCLDFVHIPYTFTSGDPEILRRHALVASPDCVIGTLTLGPK